MNLRALAHPDVLVANGAAVGLGAALYVGISIGSLIAQSPAGTGFGIGLPLFWAGFLVAPLSFGSLVTNRSLPLLRGRVAMTSLLPIGALIMALSSLLLWWSGTTLWGLAIGMFGFGVGMGSAFASMPTLISSAVDVAELGSAVGFNQVLRTVGGSLGAAISGAILVACSADGDHVTAAGVSTALAVGCRYGIGGLCSPAGGHRQATTGCVMLSGPVRAGGPLPPPRAGPGACSAPLPARSRGRSTQRLPTRC